MAKTMRPPPDVSVFCPDNADRPTVPPKVDLYIVACWVGSFLGSLLFWVLAASAYVHEWPWSW